jgi:hypothetical protein
MERLILVKEKLIKIDGRARNIPIVWGESDHARDKKTITLIEGVHNDDTLTFIAIHLLAHCLNPVYVRTSLFEVATYQCHSEKVKEFVRRARHAKVLNLDNVICDTSFFREKMMNT